MTYREGKVWGETVCIERNPFMSIHRLTIKAGFKCSRHRHHSKTNGFFVESGHLIVRVFQDNGLIDETHLKAGDYTSVPFKKLHQFESKQDTVLFEFYWPAMSHNDIDREDTGGPA